MILLALDAGRKKTGVAIGNTVTGLARPLTAVHGGRTAQLAALSGLIDMWNPQQLIVGLPSRMNGDSHAMTSHCRAFARALEKRFGLPVALVDERLTTAAARAAIKNSGQEANPSSAHEGAGAKRTCADSMAAGIILQNWLNANCSAGASAGPVTQVAADSASAR